MVEFTNVPRANVDAALGSHSSAAHLRPIWLAVRDHGLGLAIVPQGRKAFRMPDDRPAVCILGDDMHEALGPKGFHGASIRNVLAESVAAVVVSSAAHVAPYAAATATAVGLGSLGLGRAVVLVETRPEREAEWMDFIHTCRPDLHVLLSTVEPMGGVH